MERSRRENVLATQCRVEIMAGRMYSEVHNVGEMSSDTKWKVRTDTLRKRLCMFLAFHDEQGLCATLS